MDYTSNIQDISTSEFLLVIAIVFIVITFWYLGVGIRFFRMRKYIKLEILRSVGNERIYWKRELKKLYVSQVPLLGRYLCRLIK